VTRRRLAHDVREPCALDYCTNHLNFKGIIDDNARSWVDIFCFCFVVHSNKGSKSISPPATHRTMSSDYNGNASSDDSDDDNNNNLSGSRGKRRHKSETFSSIVVANALAKQEASAAAAADELPDDEQEQLLQQYSTANDVEHAKSTGYRRLFDVLSPRKSPLSRGTSPYVFACWFCVCLFA
jgi:hypothetical protein